MIAAKANSAGCFLQRNLTKCPPSVEYACTVWLPYQQQGIKKLEMVQQRAARFVMN